MGKTRQQASRRRRLMPTTASNLSFLAKDLHDVPNIGALAHGGTGIEFVHAKAKQWAARLARQTRGQNRTLNEVTENLNVKRKSGIATRSTVSEQEQSLFEIVKIRLVAADDDLRVLEEALPIGPNMAATGTSLERGIQTAPVAGHCRSAKATSAAQGRHLNSPASSALSTAARSSQSSSTSSKSSDAGDLVTRAPPARNR